MQPVREDAEGAQFAGLGSQNQHRAQDNADALFSIHGIPADLYNSPPGYIEESQLVPYGPDAKLIDRFDCRLLLDPEDIELWSRTGFVSRDTPDECSSEEEALNHLRYYGLYGPEESSTAGAGEEDDYLSERNEYGSVPFSYEKYEGDYYEMGESNYLFPPPAPLAPSILKQQYDKHTNPVVAWGPATLRQMAIISLVAKHTAELGGEKGKLEEFRERMAMYGDFGFLSAEHNQHGIFTLLLKQWKNKMPGKEVIVKGGEHDSKKYEINPLQMILDYDDDQVEPTVPQVLEDSDFLLAKDAAVKGFLQRYCISHGIQEVDKILDSLHTKSLGFNPNKLNVLFVQVKEELKGMKEFKSMQHEAKFDQTLKDKSPVNPQDATQNSSLLGSNAVAGEDSIRDLLSEKNQSCLPDEKLQALRRAKAQSLLRKRQLEVQQKTKSRRESFVQQSEMDRQKKMAAIGQHKRMFLDSDSD